MVKNGTSFLICEIQSGKFHFQLHRAGPPSNHCRTLHVTCPAGQPCCDQNIGTSFDSNSCTDGVLQRPCHPNTAQGLLQTSRRAGLGGRGQMSHYTQPIAP